MGPRPLDGHNLWPCWTGPLSSNLTSPRTEVIHQVAKPPRPSPHPQRCTIHETGKYGSPETAGILVCCDPQVVNQYTAPNCTQRGPCAISGFGNTIRVGKYKLHLNSKPGPDYLVPWPEPAQHPVQFGRSGGGLEPGTDHMRAGGVKQNSTGHTNHICVPSCLFDVVADPGEQNDLAANPAMVGLIASLTARVEAAAATGPPWAWEDHAKETAANNHNCVEARRTGFYEPVLEVWPPPEPPPPPPPSPIPTTPAQHFEKGGQCLAPGDDGHSLTMGTCGTVLSEWQAGWIRGQPTLESVYLRQQNVSEGWCITTGQVVSHPQCAHSMQPHYRSCYDGVKPQVKLQPDDYSSRNSR